MTVMQPITMAQAEEMGVPACFSEEYAFHEHRGTLAPYAGPVEPDSREDVDYDEPSPDDAPDVVHLHFSGDTKGLCERTAPSGQLTTEPADTTCMACIHQADRMIQADRQPANRPGHSDPWCEDDDCDGNCCPF